MVTSQLSYRLTHLGWNAMAGGPRMRRALLTFGIVGYQRIL